MTGKADKNLPYDLENMSIPDLEALLQQDFLASDGSSPDVDYMMAIVEVIHKKEQAQPDYQPLDTEKAWEEFQSFFNTQEGRQNSIYRSDEEINEQTSPSNPKPFLKHRAKLLRSCLLAAACLCLLVVITCVPVFGYHNIVHMLASWTAEQFGFYMPPEKQSDSTQIPKEFEELQDVMQQLGAELVVPEFPDGFEAKEPKLEYFIDNSTLQFSIVYQQADDYYIFNIYQDGEQVFNRYEKSDSLVETKVYNNIKHYFLENNGNSAVAWYIGITEYYLVTNQTTSDLKEILQSTYNE